MATRPNHWDTFHWFCELREFVKNPRLWDAGN